MANYTKGQRVKLSITGFELAGKVIGETPAMNLANEPDQTNSWVTIHFDGGHLGCYHSKNVVHDHERQREKNAGKLLEL